MKNARKTHAMIVAAGNGQRSGLDIPKQFAMVCGKPMIRHSTEAFLKHPEISDLWIVIGQGQEELLHAALNDLKSYNVVIGGDTRQQSVFNGLRAIESSGGCDQVLIHDAARPFLELDIIDRLIGDLASEIGVIPVLPVIDTIIEARESYLDKAKERTSLRRVQTPQAFRYVSILDAHKSYKMEGNATDDAQILKLAGHQVRLVEGDERLKKYTVDRDFSGDDNKMIVRTGLGFDVHRLALGEDLWLGGIQIEYEKGLEGHSDADVLLHALTDALLGAIGAGDIGDHFPPSDPKWKGAASRKFVSHAAQLIADKGGVINSVDMTVICEAPKIKPHREMIQSNIAQLLGISTSGVSVKATTTEGLGFTGRGEGIAAQAIATISLQGE